MVKQYGANVESTDNQGRNALSYARNAKSLECIQLLLHNGSSDNPQLNNQPVNQSNTNTLPKKTTSTSYIGFLNNALSNCNANNANGNSQSGHYDKIPFNVV